MLDYDDLQNMPDELDDYLTFKNENKKKKIRAAMFTEKQSLKQFLKQFLIQSKKLSEKVSEKVSEKFPENFDGADIKNAENLSKSLLKNLIENDPEFDFNVAGMIVDDVERIYLDKYEKTLYSARIIEEKIFPDGTVSRADFCDTQANVCSDIPLNFTGQKIRLVEAVLNFAFTKIIKISHSDPIAFDALYKTAKMLYESCMLWEIGLDKKGENKDKLIFKKNGKPYRAYLEGRISEDSYLLLMHLSPFEIKSLNSIKS